jgi:hypothetical protein
MKSFALALILTACAACAPAQDGAHPCGLDAVASFAGTNCGLVGGTVLIFPSESVLWMFSSAGSGTPQLTASNTFLTYDPNGPNAFIFLTYPGGKNGINGT